MNSHFDSNFESKFDQKRNFRKSLYSQNRSAKSLVDDFSTTNSSKYLEQFRMSSNCNEIDSTLLPTGESTNFDIEKLSAFQSVHKALGFTKKFLVTISYDKLNINLNLNSNTLSECENMQENGFKKPYYRTIRDQEKNRIQNARRREMISFAQDCELDLNNDIEAFNNEYHNNKQLVNQKASSTYMRIINLKKNMGKCSKQNRSSPFGTPRKQS